MPVASRSQAVAPAGSPARRCSSTRDRRADTWADSSAVRAGASPVQNGTVGGAPAASVTRTTPPVTWRIRHEWVPSRKMSPADDSSAQSSVTVPIKVSSGSATTRMS